MESTVKKIGSVFNNCLFIFITTGLILQSCWTFDSSIKIEDEILNNFKIIQDKDNERAGFVLVLNYDEEFFETIVENCLVVYSDSVNIYVKSNWNAPVDSSAKYYQIEILSDVTENKRANFKNQELTAYEYKKKIDACIGCVKRSYSFD